MLTGLKSCKNFGLNLETLDITLESKDQSVLDDDSVTTGYQPPLSKSGAVPGNKLKASS